MGGGGWGGTWQKNPLLLRETPTAMPRGAQRGEVVAAKRNPVLQAAADMLGGRGRKGGG